MELDKPRKSKLRHLRLLLYLVPIMAIVAGYGVIIIATGETYPFTIVLGHSMTPTILPGSVALIDKVPFNSLKVGDIIVFVPEIARIETCDNTPVNSLNSESPVPCFVIHRIVNIVDYPNGTRMITTKGDDNPYSINLIDTNITSSMYIGKVILQIPEAGYITTSPTNEIIAAIILVALATQLLYERSQSKKGITVAIPPTSGPA